MRRAAALGLAAVVLAPASAGASTTRPMLALTATPARVALAGSGLATVRVVNPGRGPVFVDVARAGFSLDRRGRPKIARRGGLRAATAWLAVRPRRFVLHPGASRLLTVRSRVPRRAEPGDHDALVLLTTRRRRSGGVAVRMRIGVVVVVRAPGRVIRRLALRRVHVRRGRRVRLVELVVANRGNVTETLERGQIRVELRHGGARASLRSEPRELRPRTSGVVQLHYAGRLRGWVTARAWVVGPPGANSLVRTFRIRL
ncbi:MAG TPA: hypothetical protein VFG75_06120 [Gaiella sp.]|nr:hypothetical protein [Gaiella sp.]